MIEISPGTDNPLSLIACIAPMAIKSFIEKQLWVVLEEKTENSIHGFPPFFYFKVSFFDKLFP